MENTPINQFCLGWWGELAAKHKMELSRQLGLASDECLIPFDGLAKTSQKSIKKYILENYKTLVCYLIGEEWL